MTIPHFPLLFADRGELLRDMGSGFRGSRAKVDATEIVMVIAATIGAVVIFWLLARFASLREGRGPSNNPRSLFRQLCHAHHLSRSTASSSASRRKGRNALGAGDLPSPGTDR